MTSYLHDQEGSSLCQEVLASVSSDLDSCTLTLCTVLYMYYAHSTEIKVKGYYDIILRHTVRNTIYHSTEDGMRHVACQCGFEGVLYLL